MKDEYNQRANDIFNDALERPPTERSAFLQSACGCDVVLHAQVTELLAAHAEAGEFLASPTQGIIGPIPPIETVELKPLTEGPGAVIGRYKLLQPIGEGGFGVVYMAEQEEPIRRRVALKVIKLGMDTRQVVARFEAERQALAMMDHPNIARVFDGGATESGRPYFVMELVKGVPITQYCDDNNLTIAQRLGLFRQVCQAVQHAHQKGVIHRDLKPSNVMVTLHDGVPVPKVIDFGISKATNQRLTERTLFTEYGQFIGTPQYVAPEQAEMSGLDVDTRADIYSLGVLLYELLTGTTPLDAKSLRAAGYAEMQRMIKESESPKPSTRISTLGTANDVAKHRQTEPGKLSSALRGDLDWIVLKALEKDRTRRYETANDLAADLQRHLDDEPVLAGPPTAGYRLRKFVRRNRAAVLAGSLVAAALVLGIIGTSGALVWALREREFAEQARVEAEGVTTFLSDMLAAVDPGQSGKDVSVRQVLDQASKTIGEKFTDNPLVEARLRSTIGKSYFGLGLYDEAERHLPVAVEMYRRLRGEEHVETIRSMNALTYLYSRQGRLDEAWALNERAVENARHGLGEGNAETLMALHRKGGLMWQTERLEGLLTLQKYVLEQRRRTLGEEHLDTLNSMNNLGLYYHTLGYRSEAASLYEQTVAIKRRVLGDEHPDTQMSMRNLASAYSDFGRSQEGVTLAERIVAARRRVLGEEHKDTPQDMVFLASHYADVDRFAESRAMFEQALGIYRRVFGEQSVLMAEGLNLYAWTLLTSGPEEQRKEYAEEGLRLAELACALVEKGRGAGWVFLDTLALAQHMTGDTKKAVQTQDRALGIMPEKEDYRWESEGRLATYYRSVGRADDAVRLARQRVENLRRLIEREEGRPRILNEYARDLLTIEAADLRDPAAALPLAERACALAEERGTYGRWSYLDTLALAQHMTGDTAKAIETQRRALGLIPPEYRQQRKEMEERLAEYETALSG